MLWYFGRNTSIRGSKKVSETMERVLVVQDKIPPDDLREAIGSMRDLLCRSTSNLYWHRKFAPNADTRDNEVPIKRSVQC